MSTQARKERRIKERLKAGEEAIADRAQLQAQIAAGAREIDRLQAIEVTLRTARTTNKVLEGALEETQAERDRLRIETRELKHDLANSKQAVIALQDLNDELTKRLAAADEADVKKLRRKLRERGETISEQKTLICQLRKELEMF